MKRRHARRGLLGALAAGGIVCGGILGCASAVDWPAADLTTPGWTVDTGQALWQPREVATRIAGDLIVARHAGGDVMIHFSKSALPIFTARTRDGAWSLELTQRDRSYAGRGRPPKRFVWFQLPAMLDGGDPPKKWWFERVGDGEWLLRRVDGSESIRIFLDR
ncbi:MAG: hypothetical protein AAF560_13490 [Acidobacteriota bacterium]